MNRPNSANRAGGGARLVMGIAAVVLAVAACGGGASSGGGSKSPYTIAYVADLTGGNSANSLGGQAGFNTALKEINDSGGVSGHKLQVQTYDSQSDVNAFQAQLRQALGTNPMAISGQWLSGSNSAAVSIFNSANVAVVTAAYSVPGVDTIPYWLSTSPLGPGVGKGAVNGVKAVLGGSLSGKKVAFEGLNSPAVDANLAAIKSQVDADGGSMGMVVRDPISFSSWSSQASNMAASKPDAVVVNNTDGNNTTVVKALAVAGLTVPVVATEGANSDQMLAAVSSPNFYAVREHNEPAAGSKVYKDAISGGATVDQINQSYFGKMYAAAYIISNTLAKCGSPCDGTKFASTLTSLGKITIPNDVLLGPVDFSKGHAGLTTAQIWAWDTANKKSIPKGATFPIV
jgi:ABC-type branched-subunit amino acid transport system substrate-binding protein